MSFSHDTPPLANDKILDLCDQFEALPLSDAFDSLIDKHLLDHKIVYQSEKPIHLTNDTLTKSLADTFFFPHSSILSDIEMRMVSDKDNGWVLDGSFMVGSEKYAVLASNEDCTLSGEDSTGNTLTTRTEHAKLLSLLTHIIAQENDTDPSPILSRLSELPPSDGYRKMLMALGNLNGRVSVTRVAQLPYEHDDRAIIATLTEQESPRISGINTKLMLNWQIFDTNTETTATLNEIRNGGKDYSGLSVRYVERNGTIVPTDEYLISKQIPELYEIGRQTETPHMIDPRDDQTAWIHTSATFMATIGPLLEEFRYLDES